MSRQIAVRLSEELVEFVDTLVAEGKAPSRASVVARALSHEQRRMRAARDVAILTELSATDDFDDLARFGARQSIDLD